MLGAFAIRPLAGVLRWEHVQLGVTLATLEIFAGPGPADRTTAIVGLSSGVSLAFY